MILQKTFQEEVLKLNLFIYLFFKKTIFQTELFGEAFQLKGTAAPKMPLANFN